MGLLDIFGKLTGKTEQKATAQKLQPQPQKKHSDAYFAFDDKYYDSVHAKIDKIWEMEEEFDDPDKTVKNYNKMLEKFEDLKKWCLEKEGGGEFYEEEVLPEYEGVKENLENFLKNDYEEAKKEFEEVQEHKKTVSKTKKQILSMLKEPMKKTELEKAFPVQEDDCNYCAIALSELLYEGKIVKGKEGNRVIYSVKK